jgi:hypothetical protein
VTGTLAAPLARALKDAYNSQFHGSTEDYASDSSYLAAALRADPEVLVAMAEALRSIPDCDCDAAPGRFHVHQEKQAAALLDALLGKP